MKDEAKYQLIAKGVDAFSTMYEPKFSFRRDAHGTVTGYEQNGKFNPRISSAVTSTVTNIAAPSLAQSPSVIRPGAKARCISASPSKNGSRPQFSRIIDAI